jgi:hypothetical protein
VFLVASSWPSPQSSSYVLSYALLSHHHGCPHLLVFLVMFFLAIAMVVVVFLCSWLFLFSHRCGRPFVFFVTFILVIVVVMVVFCVPGCSLLGHRHGRPFEFLVALLLGIIVDVLLCS